MMKRLSFYGIIALLVVIDSFLLSGPNLLGKIGLFIYKYSYLRTFPRTLFTVFIAVFVVIAICELIRFLVIRETLKSISGKIILISLIVLATVALAKTGIDFSTWTYGHTGVRFRCGAYLLPAIWIVILVYTIATLPKANTPWPTSPSMDETKVQQ
ncbi:MAG TPA: hypothetical protein VIT44_07280 [Cyclobacteriaceae bacterium]